MRTEKEMVAYALEIEPSLLPHLPELLADLDELGSDAELITQLVVELGLPDDTKVVDLGCGKGAVAVEIADELGYEVLGIDLFEPFIKSCHELALKHKVSDLCDFKFGNLLEMASEVGQYDIAIFAALGDVLGPPDETMKVIREYVKPDGLIIVSDLYLAEGGSNNFPGFERYRHHDETLSLLTARGDTLVREVIPDDYEDEESQDNEAEKIRARAEALALQYPSLEQALMAFASDQAAENAFIEANLVDAVWVLRKS